MNSTHYPPCQHDLYPTPDCPTKCRKGYKTPFNKDKHYGKDVYNPETEEDIQVDIYKNGPVG